MTRPCEACEQPVLAGMRFCGHCGAPVGGWWACSSCAGANPPGMRFCGHCGGLSDAASEAAAPAPAADDVSETLRSFVAGQVAERLIEAGGVIPEERRLVTALFADVSGFTALADRLDPEQLLEVIDPLISALTDVVGRYEGYVEKFAGDALLALFGAPVSHEDDAQRALHVALEMHRELERIRRGLGPSGADLSLHVGVNSGHGIARVLGSAARMDYAVLGDSVILAQRLESAAPPGDTYVSDLTYRLARDDFEFEPIGALTLKGKLEPVVAWRLLGARTARAHGAAGAQRLPLIGRGRELDEIESALGALGNGRGSVVVVSGEPGVGKSRLTAAVRASVESAGRRWLETRCLSYGAALPYWPYAELLRSLAGIEPNDEPQEAGRRLAQALGEHARSGLAFFARLLDAEPPADDLGAIEPETFRRGLHDAFASWLVALGRERPFVLAIEDYHWADSSSRALTEELARVCAGNPIALYLIVRSEQVEAAAAVAVAAGGAGAAVALGPLDAVGLEELVRALLGGEPPPELLAAVAERTGGNPFFAEELVRSLQENGDLALTDGRWTMREGWSTDAVPPTVEGLLAARIDLLPRSSSSVLATASVIGRRIRLGLLRAAVSKVAELDEALPVLVEAAFLDRFDDDGQPGVAFRHALVQEVAYSRLLRRQQRELHRRVAEVAEGLYGAGDDVVELLARHLYLAEAGPKAVEYLVRAGARSKRLFANAEAIAHLRRAAELAPSDAGIRFELADLHDLVGDYDAALAYYRELRDETRDVSAWAGAAAILRKQGRYAEALALVEEAFRADDLRGADLSTLWLEQAWTLSVSGRYAQAIDVLEAGLAAAEGRRDHVVGQMLLRLARVEVAAGRLPAALEHASSAQEIFDDEGDPRGLASACRVLGSAYAALERFDEAATALRRGLVAAERSGNVEEIGGCLINLGMVELDRGALEEAIDCDRRAAAEFGRIHHGSGLAIATGNLAEKLLRAGRTAEALEHSEQALELARSIGHTPTTADVTRTLASIHLAEGRFVEAGERAEEAAELFTVMGAAPDAAKALELAADAWERAGQGERAKAARMRDPA